MGFKIRVWGDYALFTRPEFKGDRYSYDVMTPSAARGLLESIYWHPGMRWIIDKIHVVNKIDDETFKRNEIKSKISIGSVIKSYNGALNKLYINRKKDIVQRTSRVLKNVEYIIEAHFEMTENKNKTDSEDKFAAIIDKRLRRGACYRQPYLGCSEYVAYFERYDGNISYLNSYYKDVDEVDFGIMLYDFDYTDKTNITPMFFKAVMKHGVINVDRSEVIV